MYLSSVIAWFPPAAVGGSNADEKASLQLTIFCGLDTPILTDIAGDKKIFRKRGWIKSFYASHQIKAGDTVCIQKIGDTKYHIYPAASEQ
jgi:hypothetical protein